MKSRTLVAAIASLFSFVSIARSAPVIIDNFQGLHSVVAPVGGTIVSNDVISVQFTGDAIGGERLIRVRRDYPNGSNIAGQRMEVVVNDGIAGIAAGFATEGSALFQWDANGPFDLINGTNQWIEFQVETVDSAGVTFSLELDGVQVTKFGNPGVLKFGFFEFAGVDPTTISVLRLLVTGPPAFDASIAMIRAAGPSTALPIPAPALLMLSGLAGLGAMRRQRQRSALTG